MQAVVLGLIGPHASGEVEFSDYLIRLQTRIGIHLQRRRRLLLAEAFERWSEYFHDDQPLLPDPETFDWEGSMYAVPQLSDHCRDKAAERELSPPSVSISTRGSAGSPSMVSAATRTSRNTVCWSTTTARSSRLSRNTLRASCG